MPATDWYNLDVDPALAANSDTRVSSQKALKSYIDSSVAPPSGASQIQRNASGTPSPAAALPTSTPYTPSNTVYVDNGAGANLELTVPAQNPVTGRWVELVAGVPMTRDTGTQGSLIANLTLAETTPDAQLTANSLQRLAFVGETRNVPGYQSTNFYLSCELAFLSPAELPIPRTFQMYYQLFGNPGQSLNSGASVWAANQADTVVAGFLVRQGARMLARLL